MKNKILAILCTILGLALIAVIFLFVLPEIGGEKEQTVNETVQADTSEKLEIDPNAGAETAPETETEEQGIAIPGWGSITLPAGEKEAAVNLENPAANEGWYYMTFELCLKETGEVIFTTGLVPPGQSCRKVTLTRELKTGEYEAVIHVQPYKMDENQTPTNNADMETMLVVK
ncbi:MAG: hypothetical protein PHE06_07105 [Lachnospiraceae bacterium]|nr:hypothetical protein [Lachnospiraceae bacterium]MDD3795722.1 hypothetical protein [Lachnospiraceae bacterium]